MPALHSGRSDIKASPVQRLADALALTGSVETRWGPRTSLTGRLLQRTLALPGWGVGITTPESDFRKPSISSALAEVALLRIRELCGVRDAKAKHCPADRGNCFAGVKTSLEGSISFFWVGGLGMVKISE